MIAKSATLSGRQSARTRGNLRAKVATAFREVAGGVSDQEASNRTRDFYRSSETEWARNLD